MSGKSSWPLGSSTQHILLAKYLGLLEPRFAALLILIDRLCKPCLPLWTRRKTSEADVKLFGRPVKGRMGFLLLRAEEKLHR
jgi:hypothetical protein